jgi:hypothetical protein
MKHKRSLVTITAIVGLGIIGGLYRVMHTPADHGARDVRSANEATSSPQVAELAALRREMAQLRLQVRNQGRWLPAAVRSNAPEPDPTSASPGHGDPETRAEAARKAQDYLASLEAEFRKEAADPAWSSATSSAISKLIAGDDDLRSLTRDVDCRSHSCRVELADNGSGKLEKMVTMFVQRVSERLPTAVASRVEGPGGAAMVLYLTRPGEPGAGARP